MYSVYHPVMTSLVKKFREISNNGCRFIQPYNRCNALAQHSLPQQPWPLELYYFFLSLSSSSWYQVLPLVYPSTILSSAGETDKRTPLGTMRFGKREFLEDEDYSGYDKRSLDDEETQRSIRAPLGTMRFGKRNRPFPGPINGIIYRGTARHDEIW